MKTMKYFWYACLVIVPFCFTACSDDDDDQSTKMTIQRIFLEDVKSTVPDRQIEFARLGQLIRIEGSGFSGLKKVYVNGYETYFNNALLTDNNIWLTLNGNTPVDKADADVRNTIRLVKDNTETVYPFIIRASAPIITSIDKTLPQEGEVVTVYGSNLQEVTKLTLPGNIEITSNIISDEDGKFFSFVMPAGVTEGGSITMEGANGTAISANCFNQLGGYIMDYDNLGVMGNWSATWSQDDLVDDPLNQGHGKVALLVPQSVLDEGGMTASSDHGRYWANGGSSDPDNDWSRMTSIIPGDTPAEDVGIQFDVYVPEEWSGTGAMEISLVNNLAGYGYGSTYTTTNNDNVGVCAAWVWVPWLVDGEVVPYKTNGWETITVPLSSFGQFAVEGQTFQDVIDVRNGMGNDNRNFLVFASNIDINYSDSKVFEASVFKNRIYIDNFRVVPLKGIEVSDFPDEDDTEE